MKGEGRSRRRARTARAVATPARPERRPRRGTSLRFPRSGRGAARLPGRFPCISPSTDGVAHRHAGSTRGRGIPGHRRWGCPAPRGQGRGAGGGTSGKHRGWGRRRVRSIPAVLGRADGCPPRPGPARLGRGRGRELRGVLRASPLWTKSKHPEGSRLLRVGASIYLFIVPDGWSHFSEGILHTPRVSIYRPFPKSLCIPAFLFSLLPF